VLVKSWFKGNVLVISKSKCAGTVFGVEMYVMVVKGDGKGENGENKRKI